MTSTVPPPLVEELYKIPELKHMGLALVEFALSIDPNVDTFEADSTGRWVARDENFVSFRVQWKRARSLVMTVRGNPGDFQLPSEISAATSLPTLELKPDQGGYSRCTITSVRQLAAASAYIAQALAIAQQFGGRPRRTNPF